MHPTDITDQITEFIRFVYEITTLGEFIDSYGISASAALTMTPDELCSRAVAIELDNRAK